MTRSLAPRSARRLATAVLGAGLLTTGLAAPAYADLDHGDMSGYFTATDVQNVTEARFQTYDGYDPADLTVHVQAVDAEGAPVGERVEVPFTPIEEVDGGRIDVLETRQALGEAGAGRVQYGVAAGGEDLRMTMTLEADADLTDDAGSAVLSFANPHEHGGLNDAPLNWDSTVVMGPEAQAFAIRHGFDLAAIDDTYPSKVTEPSHGELHVYRDRVAAQLVAVYIPEPGFVGTDTFTVDFHSDHIAHVQTVTVQVGQELSADLAAFDLDGDGVVNAGALDLSDPATAKLVASLRATPEAGTLQPVTGETEPGEHSAPVSTPSAPEDQESAEDSTEADDDASVPVSDDAAAPAEEATSHEVPEQVQTDGGAAWLVAGLASLAAGGVLVARRGAARRV